MEKIFPKRLVTSLIALFAIVTWGGQLFAQTNVTGKVTAASDGSPVIGAGVVVLGTTVGTMTEADGTYSMMLPTGTTELSVVCLGYKTVTEQINGRSVINFVLEEDMNSLDDVVVVGYGVQKKKLVTGSTVQVKGEDIARMNTTNPLQALQGQTPGVTITSTSGQPGEGLKVTIRGLGTIGNSSPLYLIDGVGGDINSLNPSDIESIDILKDAAAAAIYGSAGANGVVLVTTKQGREGTAKVTFDGFYGVQNVERQVQMLNAQQYMMIMDEQALNSGSAPYDWANIAAAHDPDGNLYDTDWIDQMIYDNAKTQSYNLGVSGGSKTSNYMMSLGYMSQDGVMGGPTVSNYERYNFRVNSEHKLYGDILKVGEQVSFVYLKNNGIRVGNQYWNSLRGAFAAAPITPVFSDNNIYDSPYNDTSRSDWNPGEGNPYASMMTDNYKDNVSARFDGSVYAELQPIKGLRIKTLAYASYSTSASRSFTPLYQYSAYSYNNSRTSVSQESSENLSLKWTNTITYDWTIGQHEFNALAGMEANTYRGTWVNAGGGILKEGFDNWDKAYISNTTSSSSTDGLSASGAANARSAGVSYFARLGWNWRETYMINATFRADGSSNFAPGNRFGYFPSVSAGWTISNEDFMKNASNWLDFLKLRASWGQVGNASIDAFQYLAPIKSSNTHYLFGNGETDESEASILAGNWGAYPNRLANPDVKWETSEQINVGVDARFFGGSLAVTADWYRKNTKDWLVEAPILATVGAGAPYINGGNVINTGVELAVNYNGRIGKEFFYNLGVNGAYNKNEVGQIPTIDGIIHGQTQQLYDNSPEFYRAENGHAIGYFWGYETAGIFQNKQEIDEWKADGNGILQKDVKPGDVRYVDQDRNGVINDDDKVDLGDGMPDFTYGFNIGFNWKGLDFSLVASGAAGFDIVQSYRNHTSQYGNYTTAILNRWTGEGTSDRMPRVTNSNINWEFSDLYLQKGDYLRISSVTLGYDFSGLINLKNISKVRVYAQVQNAFTFTKYNGMDPEIGYGMDGWVSGIDLGYYPRPRTILLGVNLSF